MQHLPADTHQIVSQSQAPSTWISQPTATLIAASVVLLGVILTLNHNRRRLRVEQLERRAKEREQRLLDGYAGFAAAGLQLIRRLVEVHAAQQRHEELKEVHSPEKQYSYFDELHRANAAVEAEQAAVMESKTALTSAFTQLLMLDDETGRLGYLAGWFDALSSLTSAKAAEIQNHAKATLIGLCMNMGVQLHKQYEVERELAEFSKLPTRRVPKYVPIKVDFTESTTAEPHPDAHRGVGNNSS